MSTKPLKDALKDLDALTTSTLSDYGSLVKEAVLDVKPLCSDKLTSTSTVDLRIDPATLHTSTISSSTSSVDLKYVLFELGEKLTEAIRRIEYLEKENRELKERIISSEEKLAESDTCTSEALLTMSNSINKLTQNVLSLGESAKFKDIMPEQSYEELFVLLSEFVSLVADQAKTKELASSYILTFSKPIILSKDYYHILKTYKENKKLKENL